MPTMAREGSRGLKSSVTTSILSEVKRQAIRFGIPFGKTLEDALIAKIDDLDGQSLPATPPRTPPGKEAT